MAQVDLIQTSRTAEDDSPFLSMADFFSLISLTLIYIFIMFPPAGALPEDAIPVLSGRTAAPGQTIAASSRYAHLTLEPYGDGLAIRIVGNGHTGTEMLTLSLDTIDLSNPARWIERELRTGELPERVILYLPENEQRPDVHRIFNGLVGATKSHFPVSVVVLERAE